MNPNPLLALNHFTVPCSLTDVLAFILSYLCFSTASSRKAKEAASWNLQPLQSNLKVLQEQQTQCNSSMLSGCLTAISSLRSGFESVLWESGTIGNKSGIRIIWFAI